MAHLSKPAAYAIFAGVLVSYTIQVRALLLLHVLFSLLSCRLTTIPLHRHVVRTRSLPEPRRIQQAFLPSLSHTFKLHDPRCNPLPWIQAYPSTSKTNAG